MTRLLVPVMVLAMVAAACGGDDSTGAAAGDPTKAIDSDRLSVVVTTTIWGDIVSNITGSAADVEVLFPVGADAHDYQLSSAQVASMQQADLVVVNGLQLEEGILDVIAALEEDGANVLEVAALLDPIAFGEGHDSRHDEESGHEEEDGPDGAGECDPDASHEDHNEEGEHSEEELGDHNDEAGQHDDGEGHGHEEGACDPHIWMDPLRVATAAELIADQLAALDTSVDWMSSATEYADQLRSLDEEIIATLAAVPEDDRKMVTNHEAFGYFTDRYDFEVVGVVIPGGSTLADPSSAELAELVRVMKDENVNVIFAETVEPSSLADAVAAEIGDDVETVELFTGSLGGSGSGGETYLELLRTNSERIAGALS